MTGAWLRPQLLSFAPLVVLAHVIEETPGLIGWMNRRFDLNLTMGYFIAVNTVGLLITVALAVPRLDKGDRLRVFGLIAWLGFLMPANGLLHVTASFMFQEYVPGTVTAAILYLPYFVAATVTACRHLDVRPATAIIATVLGSVPMLVQGVSILTGRGRVFW